MAFGYGSSYFGRYEEQGVGIQWYNLADSPMPEDGYSMLGTMLMMMLDALIYAMVAWYVEAVFPGQSPKNLYNKMSSELDIMIYTHCSVQEHIEKEISIN